MATQPEAPCLPPSRLHPPTYHEPLLLTSPSTSQALLIWFNRTSRTRPMPWRKPWIDPSSFHGSPSELARAVSTRAYEVWVSEIMLQQTRVATVVPYYETWISKWPTVQDLANATQDEVLGVWKGLGYYSRATRLWQGARVVVERSMNAGDGGEGEDASLIPKSPEELLKIPGIGRYTAGAISSIAFGVPTAVLDGNVARVLSRQLGLYADVKEKKIVEMLWEVAEKLVRDISGVTDDEALRSEIPGQWNQAVMELGATVCTPLSPKCGDCPIRDTCRAYAEGTALVAQTSAVEPVTDIEELCSSCVKMEIEEIEVIGEDTEETDALPRKRKRRKVEPKISKPTISKYFGSLRSRKTVSQEESTEMVDIQDLKRSDSHSKYTSIPKYCSLFPKKVIKKPRAEEECVVCIIEQRIHNPDVERKSRWLIEQRPAKGLLASLWQFPQTTLLASETSNPKSRKSIARLSLRGLSRTGSTLDVVELGSITHILTHIKFTLHVYSVVIETENESKQDSSGQEKMRKWVLFDEVETATLSTGMRKCWELYRSFVEL